MIGVIGVAPRSGRYDNTIAGDHGGNMDCNLVRAGSTIYLPIFVEGGLLAMGDVHATMGDGEVGGQGIEVAAEVEIEVGTMRNWSLRRPFIETDEVWATVAAARNLVKAAWVAVEDMANYVSMKFGLSDAEALLLLSAAGDVRVCQIVTEMPTARFELPKGILRSL
jgi:amidase